MALITPFSRCAICHELLGDLPYLATSAVVYPFWDDDPILSTTRRCIGIAMSPGHRDPASLASTCPP